MREKIPPEVLTNQYWDGHNPLAFQRDDCPYDGCKTAEQLASESEYSWKTPTLLSRLRETLDFQKRQIDKDKGRELKELDKIARGLIAKMIQKGQFEPKDIYRPGKDFILNNHPPGTLVYYNQASLSSVAGSNINYKEFPYVGIVLFSEILVEGKNRVILNYPYSTHLLDMLKNPNKNYKHIPAITTTDIKVGKTSHMRFTGGYNLVSRTDYAALIEPGRGMPRGGKRIRLPIFKLNPVLNPV